MSLKFHFLLTFGALFFLFTAWNQPQRESAKQWVERECKFIKGKMDCISTYYNAKNDFESFVKFN